MSQHEQVHPWDICECGDYRDQHEGGTGRCEFGRHHNPPVECRKFKFSHSTAADEVAWRKGRAPE